MRIMTFAKRNFKEIMRDPISLIFSIVLPLVLLVIFQQFDIPNDVYKIENFAPGIVIFSYGFIILFTGTLVAKDRTSSLLSRLFASPLKPIEFIMGYMIALLPLAIIQSTLFFICGIFFGLSFTINTFYTILILIPMSIMFILIGILLGTVFSDKTVPGIASLILQLVCFASGMWFDLSVSGAFFETLGRILPFSYALDITRAFLKGNFVGLGKPFLIALFYTIGLFLLVVYVFKKKMQSDKI